MRIVLDPSSARDYQTFIKVKGLPRYAFSGRTAIVPDEYAPRVLGGRVGVQNDSGYTPQPVLFDYQRDIAAMAIAKRRFAVFADCGLGKTLILTEFARHAAVQLPPDRRILIVSPLMVVTQTMDEIARFYGEFLPIEKIAASGLNAWLAGSGGRIGITNYEALNDSTEPGRLGAMILDESSMLKSHYGKWGQSCIRLGRGIDWKLCLTGTPAPNDRIEYANHAVFLDATPNTNAFLGRFFVNRGQTGNRWELKPHALEPFYRHLSHWCIFLNNPATYGWKDNCETVPPIHVHIHDVPMTTDQHDALQATSGSLFAVSAGGIGARAKLAQIAKGQYAGRKIDTNKTKYVRRLVDSWPDESTIIWCLYNAEQDAIAEAFPEAASIAGTTPQDERQRIVDEFKAGERRVLISKPRILGFGLNLQIATRQVFSGLQDSYESYYQAVKRSNRVGSTRPLNVHIPVTDMERPMIETVLSKAKRVREDTEEQERIFNAARQW